MSVSDDLQLINRKLRTNSMHLGDLTLIAPAIYLTLAAIVVLLVGVVAARKPDVGLDHYLPSQYLAPVMMVPAIILAGWVVWQSCYLSNKTVEAAIDGISVRVPAINVFVTAGGHAQLTVDAFAAILSLVALAGTLIVMLMSLEHFGERQPHKAEYYSLLMFATAAVSLAVSASDLIAIYLSLEFLSLISYVLAAFAKADRRSAEAGLKYFLYGAACSAMMLYGMSILFGITGGSTSLTAVASGFSSKAATSGAGWAAMIFVLVGLGFKIALVPFQFWAPDTYEGAPTPITAFLSVVSKVAGIAVLIRFLLVVGLPGVEIGISWYWVLVALTALSMFFGNLVAIWQRNIKRMLAYSSIAQVGYMMIGVLTAVRSAGGALSPILMGNNGSVASPIWSVGSDVISRGWDIPAVLAYVIAYLFMNLGAFAVVVRLGTHLKSDAIEGYAGVWKISPYYAASLAVFLISLAGIPPTAGFLGKLLVFGGAIQASTHAPELAVLAVLGVVNSVISAFYYLNVVRLMFFCEPTAEPIKGDGRAVATVVAVCLVATVGILLVAKPLVGGLSSAIYGTVPFVR